MAAKILLVALGAVGALIGVVLVLAGLALVALTGGDRSFGSRTETLDTPTYALVSDAAGLGSGGLRATVRVTAAAADGGALFVGVGPAAEVDRYLSGVAREELRDVRLSPFRYDTVRVAGTGAPAAPGGQPLWTVRSAGAGERTVEVPVGTGGQRLVVMNADGSPVVRVRASFGIRAPFLRRLGVGLAAAGLLVAPLGALALVLGVRRAVRAPVPAPGE